MNVTTDVERIICRDELPDGWFLGGANDFYVGPYRSVSFALSGIHSLSGMDFFPGDHLLWVLNGKILMKLDVAPDFLTERVPLGEAS